jgi:hypothetical protein
MVDGTKSDFIPIPGNARPHSWSALRRRRRHQKNPSHHHAVYRASHSKPNTLRPGTGRVSFCPHNKCAAQDWRPPSGARVFPVLTSHEATSRLATQGRYAAQAHTSFGAHLFTPGGSDAYLEGEASAPEVLEPVRRQLGVTAVKRSGVGERPTSAQPKQPPLT